MLRGFSTGSSTDAFNIGLAGSASFKSLLQVERDDVTIGGQASVISFTAKTDGTTKGLIVYKCNGILEYRDSTNTPVITFDPKGIIEAKGYQFENLPLLD